MRVKKKFKIGSLFKVLLFLILIGLIGFLVYKIILKNKSMKLMNK